MIVTTVTNENAQSYCADQQNEHSCFVAVFNLHMMFLGSMSFLMWILTCKTETTVEVERCVQGGDLTCLFAIYHCMQAVRRSELFVVRVHTRHEGTKQARAINIIAIMLHLDDSLR